MDIALGEKYDTLVITGPNTGGKTVSIKTAGLLNAMAQHGFLIPAHESSTVCHFDEYLVDIGDEQSIEQSLSTFSGHMKRITGILELAGPDTPDPDRRTWCRYRPGRGRGAGRQHSGKAA